MSPGHSCSIGESSRRHHLATCAALLVQHENMLNNYEQVQPLYLNSIARLLYTSYMLSHESTTRNSPCSRGSACMKVKLHTIVYLSDRGSALDSRSCTKLHSVVDVVVIAIVIVIITRRCFRFLDHYLYCCPLC